jgi:hypothetical protein
MEEKNLIEKLSNARFAEIEPAGFRSLLRKNLLGFSNSAKFKQPGWLRLRYEAITEGVRHILVTPKPAWQMVLAGLIFACLLGTSIAAPAIAKRIANLNQINVSPTDSFPFPTDIANIQKNADNYHIDRQSNLDMASIKSRLGQLFLPTNLPEGFTLEQATVNADEYSHTWLTLEYRGKKLGQLIGISQDRRSTKLEYPANSYETVTVGDGQGILVHGAWLLVNGQSSWWEDGVLQLWFTLDDWTICISLYGASNHWTAENILAIAESMQEY